MCNSVMTLVLDRGYQPVNTVPFSKALRYAVKGKVDVLENYTLPVHPDWQMPAVVRLTGWVANQKYPVRFSRQNVYVRDRWRCQYCGARKSPQELTFDHVVPRSRGGRKEWKNIVVACIQCNQAKGNRTPGEARMKLLSKPVRPAWLPRFNMRLWKIKNIPLEWKDYWLMDFIIPQRVVNE